MSRGYVVTGTPPKAQEEAALAGLPVHRAIRRAGRPVEHTWVKPGGSSVGPHRVRGQRVRVFTGANALANTMATAAVWEAEGLTVKWRRWRPAKPRDQS